MNIYALQGHKVICVELNDENAKKYLKIGEIYTVRKTIVYNYLTDVYLQEIKGCFFNSVIFEDVAEQSTKNDKKHPNYNDWNKRNRNFKGIINRSSIQVIYENKLVKPPVYYVVQGRATNNDSDYIEQTFANINPLEARERAFSYLEYYVQLLHQGKKIMFKENDKLVNDEIKLEYLNNYKVTFAEDNFGIDGIAIYMVVNDPIDYMNKLDNVNDRFLIYSVQNLDEEKIETLKHSLIREYGYYRNSKIDTSRFESEVSIISKSKPKIGKPTEHVYTILETPFNFFFAKVQIANSDHFCEKVLHDFKVIQLKNTTFISKLNWHTIRIHIASMLNTEGGNVYLGKYSNGKIINCVEGRKIEEIKKQLKNNILPFFKDHKNYISFRFVKINQVIIPIVVVRQPIKNFCFYDNENNNNFYYRNNKGLNKMTETAKIAEYVIQNGTFKTSDYDQFLNLL
ncbi:MAG: RNA-binding domain-containing protein [Flavobacterium sp.]